MNFTKDIKDNSLLIVPSNIKDNILDRIDEENRLINIKIVSFNELKKELLFSLDDEASLFLMDKYKLKKEVAEEYLNNLYYVEDKKYDNKKLDSLVEKKNVLKENNLLKESTRFIKNYKSRNVYVYGYDYIDSFNNKLLSFFDNVEIVEKVPVKESNKVYEFKYLKDEIDYLMENITKLIDEGVPLDKIVICNTDDDYDSELYKIFKMSNISINIDVATSIGSTIIGKKSLDYLLESKSIESTLEYIIDNFDVEKNNELYCKILSVFNKLIASLILVFFKSTSNFKL